MIIILLLIQLIIIRHIKQISRLGVDPGLPLDLEGVARDAAPRGRIREPGLAPSSASTSAVPAAESVFGAALCARVLYGHVSVMCFLGFASQSMSASVSMWRLWRWQY